MQQTGASRGVVIASATAVALAVAFVITTVVGVVRQWSPLPWWDTWDGILRSWYRFQDGDMSALWAQHTDHRIVLGRLIFWADLVLWDGATWMVLVISLLLLAVASGIVVALLVVNTAASSGRSVPSTAVWAVAAVAVVINWSWVGSPNLLWSFQVSFYLAQALTIAALALLAASARQEGARRRTLLVAACLCAALAPWTIPAGLITPLVAFGASLLLRLGRVAASALLIIAVGSTVLYLVGFTPASQSAGVADRLSPSGAAFVLDYLGGPFAQATGSHLVGIATGALFLGLVLMWVIRYGRSGDGKPASIALLGMCAFTVLVALMVAWGRADRGLDAAVVGRYQSLLLLGWACLVGLCAPVLIRWLVARPLLGAAAVLALPIALLLQQGTSLLDNQAEKAIRGRAALAVAMRAHDAPVVASLYPDTSIVDDVAGRLEADGVTFLGHEPYVSIRARIGQPYEGPTRVDAQCHFAVDETVPMPEDSLTRIELSGDRGALPAGLARVVDSSGVTVGYADVQPQSTLGYVSATAPRPFTLVSDGLACVVEG